MRTIILDGSGWKTVLEFYSALLSALGPLGGHGSSVDAFIDSMIYGGMLKTDPPYEVIVRNVSSSEVRRGVEELSDALAEARSWRRKHYGDDVEVALRLAPD
jgi:hypothetical protein